MTKPQFQTPHTHLNRAANYLAQLHSDIGGIAWILACDNIDWPSREFKRVIRQARTCRSLIDQLILAFEAMADLSDNQPTREEMANKLSEALGIIPHDNVHVMRQPRPDRACVHVISDKDLALNSKIKVLIGGTHENFEFSINGEIVSKYYRKSDDILYVVDIADSDLPNIGVTTAIIPRLVLATNPETHG